MTWKHGPGHMALNQPLLWDSGFSDTELGAEWLPMRGFMRKQNDKAAPMRFRAQHKTEAFLRSLRGEDIETRSHEREVTAAKLSRWQDAFRPETRAVSKKRSPAEEAEYKHHNKKIGEQTMATKSLRE